MTILGLIESFSAIKIGTVASSGNSAVVAGIGTALVATASGLVVAILASICANLFCGLYQRQLAQIQAATSQLELLHFCLPTMERTQAGKPQERTFRYAD